MSLINPIYTKITRKNFLKERLAIMLKLRLSGEVLRTDGLDLSYLDLSYNV
jgi:hypothetical protein